MRILIGLVSVLGIAVQQAQAQTTLVIPDGKLLATTEGSTNSLVPGNPSVARVQFFYSRTVLGGAPRPINGLRFRPDNHTTHRPFASFLAFNFEVFVGNHPGPAYMDRFSHAGNHSADYRKVINARTVNFPAAPLPAGLPDKFIADLKFDSQFVYLGRDGLIIEMARDDRQQKYYRWYMDAWRDGTNNRAPEGKFSSLGAGCPASFTVDCAKVSISGSVKNPEAPYPGQTFWTEGDCQKAQIPVLGTIGVELTPPIDLSALGAPGCRLYNDLLWTTVTVSDNVTTGTFKLAWGKIPFDPALTGIILCHQAVGIDASYNTLGFGMSNGLKITLGPGFHSALEVGTVYGNYYSAFPNYALADDVPQFWSNKAAVFELY